MLTFNYLDQLNNDIDGLFLSSYVRSSDQVRRYFVALQMGPISARRALPCFDEPIFKATFSLTVEHEPQYRAWSNMPVENQTNLNSGLILTRFKKSIPMSSYLLALIVADFDCLTRHDTGLYRNVTMSVCVQSERKDDLYYALDIATKSIHDFEEQYQINYPLPKCDHIAVPNFDIPGMENFGCIVYSETRLLYNNQTSTSLNQQQVALIITHELSHQWFGNLVTPSWWKDFWLNEAFAEWMASITTNKLHPDWNLYEQYIAQQWLLIMQDDTISFSHPISFFRTNYDLRNWQMIIEQLENDHENFTTIERAGLIDDLFNLARGNILPSSLVFNMLNYSHLERAYIVWERILDGINYIEQMIVTSYSNFDFYEQWHSYLIDLIRPIYTYFD
ncbi:unnamed protein product [Rotaria sp. Silwood1]|nr:unnamed protein product [Rotaria sp. Silwood1]